MLRLVLIGIWAVIVTAVSAYVTSHFKFLTQSKEAANADLGFDQLSSDLMSVPVIREGEVKGYLIMELAFMANAGLIEQNRLDPLPFMKDAAFQAVFTNEKLDIGNLKKTDIDSLAADIVKEANMKLGSEVVRNVLLQQLNYIKREDIRANWIGGSGAEKKQ